MSGDLRRTAALFRRFAAGQRRAFVAAGVLLALEAATAVYQPTLIGALINFLKGQHSWSVAGFTPAPDATIQVLAVAIVVVTAVNSLADSLAEISLAKCGRAIGYNLRVALFGHLQRLSLAYHLQRRTGDVLTRITGDVQALEEFVVDSVSDLAGSFLLLAGTLAWLFYKSIEVALLALVIVPVLALVSNFFARRIKEASKRLRARESELASTAQEMLTSISVVQIYGRGDAEQRRFADQSRSAMDAVLQTARLEAAFSFTVSVLEAAVIAAVVWIGALIIQPAISAGLLVTFILQIQNMFKPTRRIIKEWNTVGKIYASVERIGELFDRKPAVEDAPDARPAPRLSGDIEFRDVSFAYQPGPGQLDGDAPSTLALNTISFRVAPGDVVALVGHSGAGKSTIAQLLPRLYDPHAGAILLDGHDIRTFTVESLRAQIAMVLQETVLFSGTVADNIGYGASDASREQIVAAAQQARAHDFIMALPDGYDTVLGERAATLSGGQRQRLAIARGFIRDAPILILDEPTTGLDAESARGVLDALRTLVHGRSALIVSHDFKLIRTVDRILVMSAGRILEEGTPEDLLASGGVYAELYAREFGEPIAPEQAAPVGPEYSGEVVAARTAPGRYVARSPEFDRQLTHAVPVPASAEMFRALTGRGQRPLEDSDFDPMLSPALSRAVPGLTDALDADAMAHHLSSLLCDGWQVEWCTPGHTIVRPGDSVCLRYQLGLREIASGRTVQHLVAGRLFPAAELAQSWLDRQVLPLAAQAAGRADLAPFSTLGAVVQPLRLVLHAFPVDPDRPGLLAATDPRSLWRTFTEATAPSAAGLTLIDCLPEVVRYDRDHCVLRYEALWRLGSNGRTVKQVVYGKVYDDDSGARVGPALEAVSPHARRASGRTRTFLIPRLRGYLPEQQITLLDAIPGSPQLGSLVRSWAADGSGFPELRDMLAGSAQIVANLHDIGGLTGPRRTLRGERAAVAAEVAAIAGLAPGLAESLTASLQFADALLEETAEEPVFAHGDLTPGQFLFDGPLIGLVDFDTTCLAEPALDLGQFTAHLAVTAEKALAAAPSNGHRGAEDLVQSFLRAYQAATGVEKDEALEYRAAVYRRISLARIAVRSWRQLKPDRVRVAQHLLEREVRPRVPARPAADRTVP